MTDFGRYVRQLEVIGTSGQQVLTATRVVCIGAGGLGCLVCSYLVAAGIGELSIIDGDQIELSNLTRQITYSENDIGQNKAQVLAAYLQRLNCQAQVSVHEVFLNAANAAHLVSNYDVIVDCSDNFKTRYLLSDICCELNQPLITASVDGFYGQIMVINPGICYRCVFPQLNAGQNCSSGIAIGPAVGVIASYQATAVFKYVTKLDNSSHMLQIDTLNSQLKRLKLTVDPECHNAHAEPGVELINKPSFIDFKVALQLLKAGKFQVINLSPQSLGFTLPITTILIQTSKLSDTQLKQLNKNSLVLVLCPFGQKSRQLALNLVRDGFKQVYYTAAIS